MSDVHNQSFFGQKISLIVHSASKSEPHIFFRFIKKKDNGAWENSSNGEGKTIKFLMEEIIMIIQVLKRKVNSWTRYHSFNENGTQISFEWQEGKEYRLWINVDNYSKVLNFTQAELMKMLLKHILKEIIEFATIPKSFQAKSNGSTTSIQGKANDVIRVPESTQGQDYQLVSLSNGMGGAVPKKEKNASTLKSTPINQNNTLYDQKQKKRNKDKSKTEGSIKKETKKALLINFKNRRESWIPKSVICSQFDGTKNINQSFVIESWIFKKNDGF